MNFELSQEQKMLRDMARKFAEQEMLPSLREYESARKVNYALLKKMAPSVCVGFTYQENMADPVSAIPMQ